MVLVGKFVERVKTDMQMDIEQDKLLETLFISEYDVDITIKKLKVMNLVSNTDKWTNEEYKIFEKALNSNGKKFEKIRKLPKVSLQNRQCNVIFHFLITYVNNVLVAKEDYRFFSLVFL